MIQAFAAEVGCAVQQKSSQRAEVAELADARDSKSREVTPHVGSIPTFGIGRDGRPLNRSTQGRPLHKCKAFLSAARMGAEPRVRRAPKVFVMEMF